MMDGIGSCQTFKWHDNGVFSFVYYFLVPRQQQFNRVSQSISDTSLRQGLISIAQRKQDRLPRQPSVLIVQEHCKSPCYNHV